MQFPKASVLYSKTLSGASAMSTSYNTYYLTGAGTYTLPSISSSVDGTEISCKNIGAAGTTTIAPAGSDTINDGNTASVALTTAGAGTGQGCVLILDKSVPTWRVLLKPQ